MVGTLMASLQCAWHPKIDARTGWSGVSILWLGETVSLICSYYISVAACKIFYADPSLRYSLHVARMLLKQPTNNNATTATGTFTIAIINQQTAGPQTEVESWLFWHRFSKCLKHKALPAQDTVFVHFQHKLLLICHTTVLFHTVIVFF